MHQTHMPDTPPSKGKCDLIMKGGITSGVVYPKAIVTIAQHYRLCGIGGTSAGAIGAVFAAAAEYRRQIGDGQAGFDVISGIPDQIGKNLQSFFQPSQPAAPLYRIMVAVLAAGNRQGQAKPAGSASALQMARKVAGVLAFAREFWPGFALALAAAAAMIGVWLSAPTTDPAPGILSSVLDWFGRLSALILVLVIAPVGYGLYRCFMMVFRDLPQQHFGLCTGKRQPGHHGPGLIDWMHEQIQATAGRSAEDPPLKIGDLKPHGIDLASMTTDLSSGRPYQLPLKTRIHYFSKREFEAVFDARFVDHLIGRNAPLNVRNAYGLDDLYLLPTGHDFPVLLVARMSLSFPGLISAIPLYKFDYTFKSHEFLVEVPGEPSRFAVLKRCLFSDGGISSNFPVHFFDSPLPGHPTFGISLAEYDEHRHGTGPDARIDLPAARVTDSSLPVRDIGGMLGFLMAILNTAKDWQDTLQRLLPGFSDRIVELRLAPDEGGMNLTMNQAQIDQLVGYGAQAGTTLVEQFCFDEHRWKRLLTTLPGIEASLEQIARRYDDGDGPDHPSPKLRYADVISTYDPTAYKDLSTAWRQTTLRGLAEKLADIGRASLADTLEDAEGTGEVRVQNQRHLPFINAGFRLIASADRVPKAYKD